MLEIIGKLTGNQALLTSQLFDKPSLDRVFWQHLKRAKKNIAIESPYLTKGQTRFFILSSMNQVRNWASTKSCDVSVIM